MTVRRLAMGLLLLAGLVQNGSATATAVEVIKDGGFEAMPASGPHPNWVEGGVFAPICGDDCDGGETAGPRTGTYWAWLGGTPTPDQQFVLQEVTIPAGTATLTFYLRLGASSGNGLDAFRVFVDNDEVFELFEGTPGYESYKEVRVDLTRYAGSGLRDLSFEYAGFGGGLTNFSADDISLQAGPLSPKSVTLKGPKAVDQGKKAKLKAAVTPCAGHEGDAIELFRGKKRVATAASDTACTTKFKVKIKKTASFTAVSPKQDADHEAGTSKKLKVRAKS